MKKLTSLYLQVSMIASLFAAGATVPAILSALTQETTITSSVIIILPIICLALSITFGSITSGVRWSVHFTGLNYGIWACFIFSIALPIGFFKREDPISFELYTFTIAIGILFGIFSYYSMGWLKRNKGLVNKNLN